MAPGALTIAINGTNFSEKALLKGTKSMCNEGGCGVCTVTVKRSLQEAEQAINSCLVPIHACNGWHVTTIEGLGNTETGYNKIQENLADYNGSQCGFCSPGMVMTMYGAARQLGEGVTEKLESCFDGNICRCTGYRPIMNAIQQCVDIETIQIAAHTLGIPMDMIKVQTTTSTFNIDCFDTGGSVTSDMNCLAVKKACEILLKAMEPHKKDGMSWKEIVHKCRLARVDLHAKHQATSADICPEPEGKGAMFHANVFGTACSEVELDILTGNYIIRRMDLLYDCGASFSPEIDIGQIEGGVVMGLGLTLHEEYKYDPKTKQPLTTNTWTYNVPLNRDIPEQLRVTLIKDKPNKIFSLGSKIVGEPPMIFAESAVLALRNCVSAYRRQHNNDTSYFSGDTPLTVEKIHLALHCIASSLLDYRITAYTIKLLTLVGPLLLSFSVLFNLIHI